MISEFVNFYQCFIQGFNKIVAPFILMLKITSITSAEILPKVADIYIFQTFKAKLAFLKLKQAFTETLIFYQFDLKCYI